MNLPALPVLAVALPLLAALAIFPLPERRARLRRGINLGAAVLKLLLVAGMVWGVAGGMSFEASLPWLPGRPLVLRVDALSLLFLLLSSFLWLLTTLYAVGYMAGSPRQSRFFGFFSLCVMATAGIALAGNLVTFFFFYELLTLATYPLVVHRGTAASRRAGAAYLRYTLGGGAVLLLGIVWLEAAAGPIDFARGAALQRLDGVAPVVAVGAFGLMLAGLGVKAALVPLHGWLPQAMIAPAPVSALLHAVAVVKAGAFGIVRLVHDVYGVAYAEALGLLDALALVAAATIIWGSLRALTQDELKKRLAYSTVSQVAYIALGVAVAGPGAMVGGIVHIVHQGLMKITLFFAAGNVAETLEVHRVSEMDGLGRRMPLTMAAFSVGALGMIGVPPLAGFVSKWFLGTGAFAVDSGWVVLVLAASSLLNAAYFLPILHRVWFRAPTPERWQDRGRYGLLEAPLELVLPPLITGAAVLGVGVLAASTFSPVGWAQLVARRAELP